MILSFVFTLLSGVTAQAQWQQAPWLHLDYTYQQRETKELERVQMNSRAPAGRGEFGLNLMSLLAISAGGSYTDFTGDVRGTTTTGATAPSFARGYLSETRALAHLIYAPFVISGGLAQRNAFVGLAGAYRERTTLDYQPIQVTVNMGPLYVRLEHDLFTRGEVSRTYGDQGGGRKQVKSKLSKANGQGAEIGLLIPGRRFATHVFVSYHRWRLEPTATVSNGVENVNFGQTESTLIEGGLGLAF